MGEKAARKVEIGFKKEHGWMDRLHGVDESAYSSFNERQILEVAVRDVINQLISSGVIEIKKAIDTSIIASLMASKYEQISDKTANHTPMGEAQSR